MPFLLSFFEPFYRGVLFVESGVNSGNEHSFIISASDHLNYHLIDRLFRGNSPEPVSIALPSSDIPTFE